MDDGEVLNVRLDLAHAESLETTDYCHYRKHEDRDHGTAKDQHQVDDQLTLTHATCLAL